MRYHHMDFLRGALMTAGVVYHTAMVVRPDKPWNVNTTHGSEIYDGLAMLLHTFRMHAFFLLSGFFAAMLIVRMSRVDYLKERLWRIAIPMIAAALTLQLLVFRDAAWGSRFWLGGGWVGHLWFLGNLIVYMSVTACLFPLIRRAFIRLPYGVFAVAVALSFMLGSVLGWRLPESPYGTYWIAINFSLLTMYFPFYLAGVYLFLRPEMLEAFHGLRANLILAAIGGLAILLLSGSESGYRFFGYGLWALGVTGLMMHYARKLITTGSRWVNFTARSSYTLYLFHQPILILVGAYFLDLNPHAFFTVFAVGVTLACWWLHANVVEKSPALCWLYNGKPMPARHNWTLAMLWQPS